MAMNDPTKTQETRVEIEGSECGSGEPECEEEELEKLEADVKQMAEKILEYRATLPDQLKNTFASIISAQRPALPGIEHGSEPGPSGEHQHHQDSIGHIESKGTTPLEEEQRTTDKIRLLKDKISSNIAALPVVLKRVKECTSKIDKLDSYNGIIHPAFKKKKPS